MATERLFGNKIKPACAYCAEGALQAEGGGVLCSRSGIVPPEHSCKKFKYDPLKRIPPRPLPLGSYDESDFAL